MDQLPWRGPGPGRPDLPIPPAHLPLRAHGVTRKRWRYIGVYGPDLMVCAATAQVGPIRQSFWALWADDGDQRLEGTSMRPGSRQVRMDGSGLCIDSRDLRARIRLGDATPVESVCPSGAGWAWTRKRAGVPVTGLIESDRGHRRVEGLGVEDQSAGYHSRHTSWHWSAGVGEAVDGTAVAWNLVEGINDPPRSSERAIWIEGVPREPGPVRFDGLDGVRFQSGGELGFQARAERVRDDNLLVFRSRYRHVFGEFAGRLDGVELRRGFGVMERHEALW